MTGKFKVGDWVKVIVQDWDEIKIGSVLQIVEISHSTINNFAFFGLDFNGELFPYTERELVLATELEKVLS